MSDLSLVAVGSRWVLQDDEGDLGWFASQAQALAAAGHVARVCAEPRVVLICDAAGEWDEALVEPDSLH